MLMTSPVMRYKTALVNALRTLGPGWHTRGEIAAAMDKNKLNPGELMMLADMVSRGEIIEGETFEGPRENVLQWHYRIKGENE